MRRRSTRWLSAALVAASALAGVPAADAAHVPGKRVRVFAMGPKLDLAWMESRQTYRDKMFALADKRLRGTGKPLVQDGADDFASHLSGRDLVLWPEDIGLFAALTGQRAAPARNSGSLEGSIVTLIGLYGPQNSYYAERYPDLGSRVPQTRLLALSLTDTYGRVAIETFSEMADRYDVYLEAGVNMAQDWHVVCDDKASAPRLPGGVRCDEQNPQKVDRLGDPFDPQRSYVYEATTPKASNMALVFDPDGRLVSKQVKAYITPIELNGQLDLVPGTVSDGLGAVRTPVGTLGFVTSKDAWMPDVLQKLDQRHVDLLVQPEFFVNDLIDDQAMWAPDTLRASGYNDVLRHPSIETMVLPELAGNIFNFSADAQQHIAVKPRRGGRGRFLAGQPPGPGLVDVLPFVVADPVRADEDFAARRRRLTEAARKLRPGSGVECPDASRPGPCENGHVEGVLWRDVTVDRRPRYRRFRGRRARTRFSRSRPVRRSRAPQRNAAVAMKGKRVVLAFEERRGGRDQVLLVRSRDGGRTWSRAVRPTGRRRGSTDEWWPAVARGAGGRVTVAWVDGSSGRERVYFAQSRDGGRTFGAPKPLDPSPPRGVAQWRPALAYSGRRDVVHAVFVDERERSEDDDLPQAHVFYTRIAGGSPERSRRLDTGEPATLAAKLDNSWAPRISSRGGRVLVTWTDFLNYDWDVFSRLSEDGGESFGPQTPVNDTPADDEALDDSPEAALGGTTPFVAWTDFRKRDSTGPNPHPAYDTYLAVPGKGNLQVDPYGARQVSTFSPSICASKNDDVLVAFQDASRGQNDIRIVGVAGGLRGGRARRVDDAGSRGGNAWRPKLGCWGSRVVAVWEDERDGPSQLYSAVASARRLR